MSDSLDRPPKQRALIKAILAKKIISKRNTQITPRRHLKEEGEKNQNLPLSFSQERVWFFEQFAGPSATYNISRAVKLTGHLNISALERAIQTIVHRHEVLRTTIQNLDGQPVQVIEEEAQVELSVVDLSELPPARMQQELEQKLSFQVRQPFDLSRDLMLRTTLFRLENNEYVFLLTIHHVAADGWSLGVFTRELNELYTAFCQNRPGPLPELPIQYADFALWQRQWFQGDLLASSLSYWKEKLGGQLPILHLPSDRPRPPLQTFRGALYPLRLPQKLTTKLKIQAQQSGATLFMTLLAAFKTLLYRYTGQEDIIVGSPIAGRDRLEIEGLIGFFVNTLALRTDLSGNPTFRDLLDRVRQTAKDAYAHQELPYERLIQELQLERDLSREPLYQVIFALQNMPEVALELPDLTLSSYGIHKREAKSGLGLSSYRNAPDRATARCDLTVLLKEEEGELQGVLEYNTDLFDAATIKRMVGHFHVLLEGIVANPDQQLSQLPLLTEAEKHQLLVEWNKTQTDYPANKCIHHLFEEQVERTPLSVAVVFEDKQLTYRQLNSRANQLAHHLHKLGVGPDVLVGICVERSLEMVVGLLGILKAGGAYVPLDPAYPTERLAFMLEDTRVRVLLSQRHLVERLPATDARLVCLDSDSQEYAQNSQKNTFIAINPSNLAYINYTSGSTGKPKGVEVVHRGVTRLLFGVDYASLDSSQTLLVMAPISFDAATFELWGALLHGGKCVLFPGKVPTASELSKLISKHKITTIWLPSALFNSIIDHPPDSLSGISQLLIGGEALSSAHVSRALATLPNTKIINGYGPTESTTFSCCYPIFSAGSSIPIGRPIGNTLLYILDSHLQPVPIGVPGELHIGGDGLVRCYLNRPELTADKFIPNPFIDKPGSRLYKTGDLVRYLPDGKIEFLCRIDNQIKMRGFRIELGEIEAVLGQHRAVKQTAVTLREDIPGDKRLIAYIVPHLEVAPTTEQLRRFLTEKLPNYMVPAGFVFLENFPLTPNGKIDRATLPVPDWTYSPDGKIVAPRTLTEEMVARIWAEVFAIESFHLGSSQINIYDNFFELGGHSLVAVELMAKLRKVFQVELPLSHLFENPTIAGLAERIETSPQRNLLGHQTRQNSPSSLVPIQAGGSKRPLFIIPGAGGDESALILHAKKVYLLGADRPVYGFLAPGSDGKQKPYTRVEEIAAEYIKEMRSLQPTGPYLLEGGCIGGVVAFEMAQQLRSQGEKAILLLLSDTICPSNIRELRVRVNRLMGRLRYDGNKFKQFTTRERLEYIFYIARRLKEKTIFNFRRVQQKMISIGESAKVEDKEKRLTEQLKMVGPNYLDMILRYRPKTYHGPITLQVNRDLYRLDPTMGWRGGSCWRLRNY